MAYRCQACFDTLSFIKPHSAHGLPAGQLTLLAAFSAGCYVKTARGYTV
jgi:hypothetical protein